MLSHLINVLERLNQKSLTPNFDIVSISKYLYMTVKYLGMTNVESDENHYSRILNITTDYLKNFRSNFNSLAYCYQLKTFNIVSSLWILDLQMLIGKNGEEIFSTALHTLNQKITDQLKRMFSLEPFLQSLRINLNLKTDASRLTYVAVTVRCPGFYKFTSKSSQARFQDELMIFFHIQLTLHNPCGEDWLKLCRERTQLYTLSDEEWKTFLVQLFENLVESLRKDHYRSKFSTKNHQGSFLNSSFVNLLSELVYVLIWMLRCTVEYENQRYGNISPMTSGNMFTIKQYRFFWHWLVFEVAHIWWFYDIGMNGTLWTIMSILGVKM
ncbi:hypothetical protein HELRODRAFT_173139 [Helobdella robusta]|uniref:Uncharacterized protein n=1 Tax=Helobdella robusta TaxID=6412 RepID=T1F6F8_HELRO|nr:hypothetical protein HELRODRAFT_173139 [Helobdella robusta]ESO04065.1 hypothetical protein HELRODRAFT_173139 [Helobdella robusta]